MPDFPDVTKSVVERIRLSIQNKTFTIDCKRDDLIAPIISGNKWRKLEYSILHAKSLKKEGILTFGGAFSNHLVATAKAAQMHGLKSIGIVRGDELTPESNTTLKNCAAYDMQLIFVKRSEYSTYKTSDCLNELKWKYPTYFIVPEGGKNYFGTIGCQAILKETTNDYHHIYLAGGTGTTAAGILLGCHSESKVHVVSALKGDFLRKDIREIIYNFIQDSEITDEVLSNLIVHSESHFGGYGKVTTELIRFINSIYKETRLKLDPIYTAKAFYQLHMDLQSGILSADEKVLFIHTGGLQGALTWEKEIDYLK